MANYDKDLVVRPRLPDRGPRSFKSEVQQVDPQYNNTNVPGYEFSSSNGTVRVFEDKVTKHGY